MVQRKGLSSGRHASLWHLVQGEGSREGQEDTSLLGRGGRWRGRGDSRAKQGLWGRGRKPVRAERLKSFVPSKANQQLHNFLSM